MTSLRPDSSSRNTRATELDADGFRLLVESTVDYAIERNRPAQKLEDRVRVLETGFLHLTKPVSDVQRRDVLATLT